jgi:dethiobiotin synthetase
MRGRAVFVTGTDTGVGKTWVSSRLATAWTRAGLRVAALKAAESGCRPVDGVLIGEDDEALFQAAGGWQSERCRFRFRPAVAPGVAADELDMVIDFEVIQQQVELLRETADRVIVEGAGGWLVPMGSNRTIEDLAQCLGARVLIVGRAGLGTINHSALTVRAVRGSGLEVAAVVLSMKPDDDEAFTLQNAAEIERLADVQCVVIGEDLVESAADRIGRLI